MNDTMGARDLIIEECAAVCTELMDHLPRLIGEELVALRDFLLAKNAAYGNSALEPVRVFSKASVLEQLQVRLDDKLSRIARGQHAGEDVEKDLLGYIVLLRVSRKLNQPKETVLH